MTDATSIAPGRVYPQRSCALDEDGEWPSPTTCLWPTRAQADALSAKLSAKHISTLISIGCGEGACEAMLEARGFVVHAVDVDVLSDTSRYSELRCFCSQIKRVRPDQLFAIPEPATTSALCFLWGRALPWREYLRQYPHVPLVCIAGEPAADGDGGCATEPPAGALDEVEGWQCCWREPVRAVHAGAMLTIYERV